MQRLLQWGYRKACGERAGGGGHQGLEISPRAPSYRPADQGLDDPDGNVRAEEEYSLKEVFKINNDLETRP